MNDRNTSALSRYGSRVDFGVYRAPEVSSSSFSSPAAALNTSVSVYGAPTIGGSFPPPIPPREVQAPLPSIHFSQGYNVNTSTAVNMLNHIALPPTAAPPVSAMGTSYLNPYRNSSNDSQPQSYVPLRAAPSGLVSSPSMATNPAAGFSTPLSQYQQQEHADLYGGVGGGSEAGGGGAINVVHHHYYNNGGGGGNNSLVGGSDLSVVHNHHYGSGGGGAAAANASSVAPNGSNNLLRDREGSQLYQQQQLQNGSVYQQAATSALPNRLYLQQLQQPASYNASFAAGSEGVLNLRTGTGGVYTAGKLTYTQSSLPPPPHNASDTSVAYHYPNLSVPHPAVSPIPPLETSQYYGSSSSSSAANGFSTNMSYTSARPSAVDGAASFGRPHNANTSFASSSSFAPNHLNSTATTPLYWVGNGEASFASASSAAAAPRDAVLPSHIVNGRASIHDQYERSLAVMQSELRAAHVRGLLVVLQDDEARVRALLMAEENREVGQLADYSNKLSEVLYAYARRARAAMEDDAASDAEALLRQHYAKLLRGEQHRQQVVDEITSDREEVRERSSKSRTPSRRREVSLRVAQRQRDLSLLERERFEVEEEIVRGGGGGRGDRGRYYYAEEQGGPPIVKGARSLRRMSSNTNRAFDDDYGDDDAEANDGMLYSRREDDRRQVIVSRRPRPPPAMNTNPATPTRSILKSERNAALLGSEGRAGYRSPLQFASPSSARSPSSAGGGGGYSSDGSNLSPFLRNARFGADGGVDDDGGSYSNASRAASARRAASPPTSHAVVAGRTVVNANKDPYSNKGRSGRGEEEEQTLDVLDYRPSSALKRREAAVKRPTSPARVRFSNN